MSSLIVGRTVSVLGAADLTLNYAVNETTHDPAFFYFMESCDEMWVSGEQRSFVSRTLQNETSSIGFSIGACLTNVKPCFI